MQALIPIGLAIASAVSGLYDSKTKKNLRLQAANEQYKSIAQSVSDREAVSGLTSPQWRSELAASKKKTTNLIQDAAYMDYFNSLLSAGASIYGMSEAGGGKGFGDLSDSIDDFFSSKTWGNLFKVGNTFENFGSKKTKNLFK